jgi:hypothetical protein
VGAWAGAACGLAFATVACVAIFTTAAQLGTREVTRGGFLGLIGAAWGTLGFFTLMGAACGALGASVATQVRASPRGRCHHRT